MAAAPEPTFLRTLSPLGWPSWLLVGLLRLLELMPYPAMLRVGRALGAAVRVLAPGLRRIVRRNLELCFPELGAADRQRLLVAHFRSLGESLCDFVMTWWSSNERIQKLTQVSGLEHVDRALAGGRGVILVTAHFTTLEISARIMTTLRTVCALYKPLRNPVLAWVVVRGRARHASKAIRYDDIRGMIAALRNNEVVWYAPDQSFRKKGALLVPFFGVPAPTNPHTSRLAQLTGAPVLYMSHERLPDAAGIRIVIHPPFENFPSGDALADTQRLHDCIEADVRRVPSQYWWIHRRFKRLSDEQPDHYARARSHHA